VRHAESGILSGALGVTLPTYIRPAAQQLGYNSFRNLIALLSRTWSLAALRAHPRGGEGLAFFVEGRAMKSPACGRG
jgi:hypothetical protein